MLYDCQRDLCDMIPAIW